MNSERCGGQFGTYTHGDRLRVEIQDGLVKYRSNGTVLYTSTVSPTYPLHAEASLQTTGATIVDVAMGELVWINEAGLHLRGDSLMKTSGVGWSSGAVSTRAIDSGYVEFIAASPTNFESIVGLSSGDSNTDRSDVDYGIYVQPDSKVGVFEAGTYRGSFGAFTAGDRLRVELQTSGAVRYLKNGIVFYTSTVSPSLPLRVDTGIYRAGGILFNVVLSGDPVIGQLDMPGVTPAAGQYSTMQTVTVSHWLSGATVRYTTDGMDPTESSPLYTAPIVVDLTTTVKAKAWKSIYTPSAVRAATYTMKLATPSFSPGAGTHNTTKTVTITSSSSSATIHYTNDGSTPTTSSPVYSAPVTVDQSLTLKAIAIRTGWTNSDIGSAAYTMKVGALSLSPAAGSYGGAQTITVTTSRPSLRM